MRWTFSNKLWLLVGVGAALSGITAASVAYVWTVRAFEQAAKDRLAAQTAAMARELAHTVSSAIEEQNDSADATASAPGPAVAASELRRLLTARVRRLHDDGLDIRRAFVFAADKPDGELGLLAHDAPRPARGRGLRVRTNTVGIGVQIDTGKDSDDQPDDSDAGGSPGDEPVPPLPPPPPPRSGVATAVPPSGPGPAPTAARIEAAPPELVDDNKRPLLTRADLNAHDKLQFGFRRAREGGRKAEEGSFVRDDADAGNYCVAHAILISDTAAKKSKPASFAQPVSGSGKAAADEAGSRIGYVGVLVRPETLRSGSQAAFRGVQMGGIVAVGVGIGLGWLGSRWLTRPLADVGAGLQRMSRGDLDTPLEPTSTDDVGDMALAANHAMTLLREQIELRQSLQLAKQVQQALLPEHPPVFPGLDIAAVCRYCDQTGGDYYDFIESGSDDNRALAMVVGDVTGHGVPAALLMATARAILRSHPPTPDSLAEFLTRANREMCVQGQTGRFMTLFLLLVEPRLAGLRWASAGHDGALVYDPLQQTFSELNGSDLPLGVDSGWSFSALKAGNPLGPGQVVLIGTDGIWELRNKAERQFGKDNLQRVVRKHASLSARQIGDELLAALDAHRGDMPAQDDITFIVVKVTPADAPPARA